MHHDEIVEELDRRGYVVRKVHSDEEYVKVEVGLLSSEFKMFVVLSRRSGNWFVRVEYLSWDEVLKVNVVDRCEESFCKDFECVLRVLTKYEEVTIVRMKIAKLSI